MIGDRTPLLIDTHCWIWLQFGTPNHVTAPERHAIERAAASGQLLISAISIWEVAMLESKKRLSLTLPVDVWIREALATPGLSVAPLTAEIAIDSCNLPEPFHGDPADRIIVSTARRMGARLLSRDKKMIEYGRKRHFSLFGAS